MAKRYVAIWFRHLVTDWMIRRRPELKGVPFVLAAPERGRMVVRSASAEAQAKGIYPNMVVADCKAILPSLQVLDDIPGQDDKLLNALTEWCIRYTPIVALDLPDGLILDASGCSHLWGGEQAYLKDMINRLSGFGYHVRAAMADTAGTAWAISRFGQITPIIKSDRQLDALLPLPPAALRLEPVILERLNKLGLHTIGSFIRMPRTALRRRFGQILLQKLDQALGQEMESILPVRPIEPYQERLPCLEPIRTATGIEIALQQLVEKLCERLEKEDKGLRRCVFKGYRIDGNIQQIDIGTNRPSRNVKHLSKLFENKIVQIEPDLGIELFILEAPIVEDLTSAQDALWNSTTASDNRAVAELLDRIAGKTGMDTIRRYLPNESYWPERAAKLATSLQEKPTTEWRIDMPRPVNLLPKPELIDVTVQMPDYPPMLFKYKGKLHNISKADGPERIEQEWWLRNGHYRDYYCVEDNDGARYWLFRLGPYTGNEPKWFLHGFFA
ncbi:Y-family DNA polymerase [Polluticoccus soli]|uniref:Y-family DNA polymerase n=1 Tax=Polluticoccus soli TaxID=3034150 RepID=UPI0023E16624|nr:DNA polymerase Y family protein [Flavipsychrobacter sp. JY13-12]